METLLIGVDAGCFPVLEPLFENRRLPNLKQLIETGVSGELESQIPPWTASAWPSMCTGMNPGKHGVFDFISFEGYDYRVVDATDVRERQLWELLDENGRSSVVVNVPVTHPSRPFDGALVPGYMAPEDPQCHPDGLLEDIRSEIGEYRIYPSHTGSSTPPPDVAVEEYCKLIRMRGECTQYLVERFRPNFGFVQFQQTDTLFHEYPDESGVVQDVYESVDEEIGRLLDVCQPDTVLVVSDHGIGPYSGAEFRPNELLRREGFVETTRAGDGMPTWATIRDRQLAGGEADAPLYSGLLERIAGITSRAGLTSQRISQVLRAVELEDVVAAHAPTDVIRAGVEQVDFPESTAYVRSRTELGVRINLRDRDPEGKVPRADYDRIREELVSLLEGVRTPDGSPVFENVALREEYFHGQAAADAVDIVTIPADFDQFLSSRVGDGTFGEPSEPWNHKRHGIVIAAGSAVESGMSLDDSHLFDVAPTVLATMDVPSDERMDGSVLPFVSSAGQRDYPLPDYDSTGIKEEPDIEDRLTELGYLE